MKKGEIDLLTQFDLRSEAIISSRLARAFPGHAIVAEEGKLLAGAGDLTWYVDPLDGTTNFAHGHPFFCISMGLAERGTPVLGVVLAPALRIEWCAARGLGATRDGRTCRVSSSEHVAESLIGTGFPYDRRTSPENNFAEFVAVKRQARGVRRCGSAAIDLAFVADGTYDAYWEQKLRPWDMCAGAAVVMEAGGKITNYEGATADLRVGQVIASNSKVHEDLRGLIQGARKESNL